MVNTATPSSLRTTEFDAPISPVISQFIALVIPLVCIAVEFLSAAPVLLFEIVAPKISFSKILTGDCGSTSTVTVSEDVITPPPATAVIL